MRRTGARRLAAVMAVAILAAVGVPPTSHAAPLTNDGSGSAFTIWKTPALPPVDHWTVRRPASAGVLEVPADLRSRFKVRPASPERARAGQAPGAADIVRPTARGSAALRGQAARSPADGTAALTSPAAASLVARSYLPRPTVSARGTGIFKDMPPRDYGLFGRGLDGADLLIGLLEETRAERARRIAEENLERGEVDLDRPRPLSARDDAFGVLVLPPRFGPRQVAPVCVYDRYLSTYRCTTPSGL